MDAHFVGIDVSQDWLDVHVVPTGESFRSKNTSDGIDELAARLRYLAPERVALEATGGLERLAAAQLSAAGLPVVIVNPAQVRAFANALGKHAKTDTIDAQVIAAFAVAIKPPLRRLPDAKPGFCGSGGATTPDHRDDRGRRKSRSSGSSPSDAKEHQASGGRNEARTCQPR